MRRFFIMDVLFWKDIFFCLGYIFSMLYGCFFKRHFQYLKDINFFKWNSLDFQSFLLKPSGGIGPPGNPHFFLKFWHITLEFQRFLLQHPGIVHWNPQQGLKISSGKPKYNFYYLKFIFSIFVIYWHHHTTKEGNQRKKELI